MNKKKMNTVRWSCSRFPLVQFLLAQGSGSGALHGVIGDVFMQCISLFNTCINRLVKVLQKIASVDL